MRRRLRLLLVPILAVALPLAALAAIGYLWLMLDRETAARRTRDAAAAEAERLRAVLLARMAEAASEIDRRWQPADPARPFARRSRPHPLITEAYRFLPDGRLEEPGYDAALQQAVRAGIGAAGAGHAAGISPDVLRMTRLALTLLEAGRRSLTAGRPADAVTSAEQLIECCAAARDEFGVSLAVLAARQMTAAWGRQGLLQRHLPGLIMRLSDLVDDGAIGHPTDIVDITGFVRASGNTPAGQQLVTHVKESADTIGRVMNTAQRLGGWLAASGHSPPAERPFDAVPIPVEGSRLLGGRLERAAGGTLIVLYDLTALAAAAAASQEGASFEAALVTGEPPPRSQPAAHLPLVDGFPGVEIAVRARPGDAHTQARRTALFASALLAAFALTLVVAYFGFRDVAREVSLAAQQASFVASVSHELNTPVASIRMLAESLRLKPASSPAEAAPLLDEIVEQADRQARLIDNVLGVARIDRGRPMYRPADVDLTRSLEQVLDRLGYLLQKEGFTVHRDVPAEPVRVRADPDGLQQAIGNLVSNAVKYSGRCREIRVVIALVDAHALLQVADGGIGIEPAEQRRIFERFYRTPAAARETGGTGLGLALVRHFAESHGGRVDVQSAPGRGSTFTLRLPVLEGAVPDAPRIA